jgi:HD-like signal output (HDOD) protein
MLSWLRNLGRSRKVVAARSSRAAVPEPTLEKPEAPAEAAQEPGFLDQLAAELGEIPALSEEDEQRVSAAIVQVVDYVFRTKLDPPVMPALAPRIMALVNEPVVDIVQLSRLIEHDLAISAKLLSVANSPVFGARSQVRTVREAITFLGTEQVAQVAIGLACTSLYEGDAAAASGPMRARWPRLFRHAMATAYGSANLALRFGRSQSEQAFLGGLFHDVGKAVALRAIETLTLRGKLSDLSEPLLDEVVHRIHAFPGEEFYGKWSLPEPLMTICAQHHQGEELVEAPPVLDCVTLMSGFDTVWYGGAAERRELMAELRLSAQRLKLTDGLLRGAHAQAKALGERTQRMFQRAG